MPPAQQPQRVAFVSLGALAGGPPVHRHHGITNGMLERRLDADSYVRALIEAALPNQLSVAEQRERGAACDQCPPHAWPIRLTNQPKAKTSWLGSFSQMRIYCSP